MYGGLLAILVLDAVFLGIVILLQSGKGGGLAAMGGGAASTEILFGGRQAATVLVRATWIAGGLFMLLAVALAILSSRVQQPRSILQDAFQEQSAPQPQPLLPMLQEPAAGTDAQGGNAPAGASPESRPPTGQTPPQNP